MKTKYTLPCILLLLLVTPTHRLQAQNYRTAEAYISDFGKNERYISESLIDHSASLINGEKASRAHAELKTVYRKLENINAIIVKNDVGFAGDTSLRDTFLKMNNATLMLLDDNTLKLDDYENQRHLSLNDISNDFEIRTSNILNYYSLMVDYINAKRRFSRANHLTHDRYFSNRNIFEYDSHQSLMFYKLNVLDAKLADLFGTNNADDVKECVSLINRICRESLVQIDQYNKTNNDQSLNLATNELITFLTRRNEQLLPLYEDYIQALADSKNTEKASAYDTNDVMVNVTVLEKNVTYTKNKFDETFAATQNEKKQLIDNWLKIKRTFLKNNLKRS